MGGDLPGPVPAPGFTAQHRAKAIARLGAPVAPRVIEMIWKTREDAERRAALFGALVELREARSTLPMLDLIEEQDTPVDVKASAVNVVAVIGDPRGLETLLRLSRSPDTPPQVRTSALMGLGRFADRRATDALLEVLRDESRPPDVREAAARGLFIRSDPATAPAVREALLRARHPAERDLRITLARMLGEIGTAPDAAALEKVAAEEERDAAVKEAVADATERIRRRARPE